MTSIFEILESAASPLRNDTKMSPQLKSFLFLEFSNFIFIVASID